MSRFTCVAVLALHALVALTVRVSQASPFDATRVTLRNGLRVVLAPDSQATAVDVALWFPAGSRHEKPSQQGLSLLAARLAFRDGSSDALAPLTEVGGGGALVSTPDYTSFSATVPEEALDRALEFLADRAPQGGTRPKDFIAEQAALRSDRTSLNRPPVPTALARLWSVAWPGHPYARTGAWPPLLSERLTVGEVDDWRRSRLGISHAVLTLTGAFDVQRALALVRMRFESQPRSPRPSADPLLAARSPARSVERMALPVRLCLVGWRAPAMADSDAAVLEVLAAWLGDGPASRLSRVMVRDWKVARQAQAGVVMQQEGSLLWTLAVVAPETDSTSVEATLSDVVSTLIRQGPAADDVEWASRRLQTSAAFALQKMRQRGQSLGESEFLVGDEAAARRFDALARVTPDDLRRVAARVMTDANRAVLWVLPADGGAQ